MAAIDRLRVASRRLRTGVLRLARTSRLSGRLRRIERIVADYDPSQRSKLAAALVREFQLAQERQETCSEQISAQTAGRDRTNGAATAWQRVGSANGEVQISGIALWLVLAFYEVDGREDAASQALRRRIIRISREMKEFLEPDGRPRGALDGRLAGGRAPAGA